MKYIIDIPDRGYVLQTVYDEEGNYTGTLAYGKSCIPYTEPDRKAIEDEVWNFVDFIIWEMDVEDRDGCFDRKLHSHVFHDYTYHEARSKYEAWKKQKDEIKVGDEVIHNGEIKTVLCDYLGQLTLCNSDGHTYYVKRENGNIKKTGRHFPEVGQLLEKMRGDQDE